MPTLAEHYEVDSVAANTLSLVSPSMTPANGDVFVVKASIEGTALVIGTPTGGSQVYRLDATSTAASHAPASIYTSTVSGSPGAMTITVPFTGSGRWHSAVFERWTSAVLAATPATNATKIGTATAPSDTVTTVGNNSAISTVDADFAAVAPGTPAYRSGATQDGLHDKSTGGFYVAYYFTQAAATAGAQTIGMTAPTGQTWTMLGIEIKDSGGSSVTVTAAPSTEAISALVGATQIAVILTAAPATVSISALAGSSLVAVQVSAAPSTIGISALAGATQVARLITATTATETVAAPAGAVAVVVTSAAAAAAASALLGQVTQGLAASPAVFGLTALPGTLGAGITVTAAAASLALVAILGTVVAGQSLTTGPAAVSLAATVGATLVAKLATASAGTVSVTAAAGSIRLGIALSAASPATISVAVLGGSVAPSISVTAFPSLSTVAALVGAAFMRLPVTPPRGAGQTHPASGGVTNPLDEGITPYVL